MEGVGMLLGSAVQLQPRITSTARRLAPPPPRKQRSFATSPLRRLTLAPPGFAKTNAKPSDVRQSEEKEKEEKEKEEEQATGLERVERTMGKIFGGPLWFLILITSFLAFAAANRRSLG